MWVVSTVECVFPKNLCTSLQTMLLFTLPVSSLPTYFHLHFEAAIDDFREDLELASEN